MDEIRLGEIYEGGGFTGAYGVGFSKAVRASGLEAIYRQGVSVGSLTAAVNTETDGDTEKAERLWKKTERDGSGSVFPLMSIAGRMFRESLFGNDNLYKLANYCDYKKIVSSARRFDAVVYNETLGRREIFSNQDERCRVNPTLLRDAVVASCSLEGIFPSIQIGRMQYADGISFLIKPAIQFGCNAIFIFLNEAQGAKSQEKWWLSRLRAGSKRRNNIIADEAISAADNNNKNLSALEEIADTINTVGTVKRVLMGKTFRRLKFTFEGKRPIDLVIFEPANQVPTLHELSCKEGDISKAIVHGYEIGMRTIEDFLSRSE